MANIPTEEIFTMQEKVSGLLVSTKRLIYGGSTIKDFTFVDGNIVELLFC